MSNRLSLTEIKNIFGSFPYKNISNGNIQILNDWAKHNIVRIEIAGHRVHCHRKVAPALTQALSEANSLGLINWNDRGMGCFVPRHKMHNPKYSLSTHSWGIAIDLNPSAYPYGSTRQQDSRLIAIMKKWGFEIILRKDPMHFECVRLVEGERGGGLTVSEAEILQQQLNARLADIKQLYRHFDETINPLVTKHTKELKEIKEKLDQIQAAGLTEAKLKEMLKNILK